MNPTIVGEWSLSTTKTDPNDPEFGDLTDGWQKFYTDWAAAQIISYEV